MQLVFGMLLLCVLLFSVGVARGELIANSTYEMQRVLEGEDHLLNDLRIFIEVVEQKLNNIRIILNDAMQREAEALLDPEAFVSNPMNSLPLVRRMHKDASALYKYLKRDEGKDLQQIADYRLDIITDADVEHAADKLLRIQRTHELDERDMAKGLLHNKQYKAKLNTQDCVFLARHLRQQDEQRKAAKWLEMALERYTQTPEPVLQQMSLDSATILHELGQLLMQRGSL
ncbi:hypothetical protein KR044_010663 [Drosophila immigrans]|nr:hypothetical protein KR044_010663 [Drosophila immigrans]